MGLTSSILSAIGKALAPRPRDGIIDTMPAWSGGRHLAGWDRNKLEAVNHFRGWNYVALRAICEEFAGLNANIARIVDGDDVDDEYQKALVGKSWHERQAVRERRKRKYLSRGQRTKALANIQGGDELEPVGNHHPLAKLLRKPNSLDTAWTFNYKLCMYLELTGSTYLYVCDNMARKPCQMWVMPSHWVSEIPGKDNLIGGYEIRPTAGLIAANGAESFGVGWFPGLGGNERVAADRIIRISYPSPHSLILGHSPIGAIGSWIDISENVDSSRVQTFANSVFPGVVLEIDKDVKQPDQATFERYYEQIKQRYASVRNSGKPLLLAPGIKVVSVTHTNVELDYTNSGDQMQKWLMAAHRVGPSIVGMAEQTNFASMVAAQANFYQGNLKPKCSLVGQVFTEELAPRFEDGLCVHWKDPTPDDPVEKRTRIAWMVDKGLMTHNEAREEYELDPYEHGGDDPMLPMGSAVIPWATGEDEEINMTHGLGGQQQQPGGMPGMEGDPMAGGDPLEDVMGELLGGDAGDEAATDDVMGELLAGDDAEEQNAGGIDTPFADAGTDGAEAEPKNRIASPFKALNGVNGHAH